MIFINLIIDFRRNNSINFTMCTINILTIESSDYFDVL